jgi:quercetin dioxygenase-like cupin family protein
MITQAAERAARPSWHPPQGIEKRPPHRRGAGPARPKPGVSSSSCPCSRASKTSAKIVHMGDVSPLQDLYAATCCAFPGALAKERQGGFYGHQTDGLQTRGRAGRSALVLRGLATVKASSEQTGGRFSLTEQLLPGGQDTPLHSQPEDDETFYVLEGDLTFYLGVGQSLAASAGAVVHVPKGTAHAYRVDSRPRGCSTSPPPSTGASSARRVSRRRQESSPRKDRPTWTRPCPRPTNTGWRYWAPHPAPPLSEGPVRPIKGVSPGSPHLVKCATPSRTRDDGTTAARVGARLVLTSVPKRRTMP